MSIKDAIKGLVQSNGWNYVRLAEEMTRISGKKYTNKKLSQMILNETIRYREMILIYKILGYTIKLEKIDTEE